MSFTDLGTLMLVPFRPWSLLVLRLVPADLVFSTTFPASSWPFPAAFFVASFAAFPALDEALPAFSPAFFEASLAFEEAFLAVSEAFFVAFFAVVFVALAAFAAVWTFLATATERPAFFKSPRLALAIFATVPNFADCNFFAVAAPTPGRDVSPEVFSLPVMSSPVLR